MLLSPEERAALTGAYQARESVEFAIDHVLTAGTVNTHLEHLFRELHVETRAGAAAAALKMLERT
ncbi:hypothetical protein WT63_12820 [Burkholderia anthina]|nr:hypothetical protein WT63_12820 [Burkholderia anthina]